jgi:hypothetical protein
MARLAFRVVQTDELPPTWAGKLKALEQRIVSTEGDGLRARWEFGQMLLPNREGKKFPKGFLDSVAKETGASRIELQKRVRFAERFSTEDEMCNGVTQWPTWHQMVRDGLARKQGESEPKQSGISAEVGREIEAAIRNLEIAHRHVERLDKLVTDHASVDGLLTSSRTAAARRALLLDYPLQEWLDRLRELITDNSDLYWQIEDALKPTCDHHSHRRAGVVIEREVIDGIDCAVAKCAECRSGKTA